MPELKEVFEMTTKQIEPDLDAWREQEHRQRRANRNRKVGALAAVAILAASAAVVIARSIGGPETQPADAPSASPSLYPVDPAAVRVTTNFVESFGAFDAERAVTYLADDADLQLDATTPEELPLLTSFLEAQGYEQILVGPCSVTGTWAGGTLVGCPFDFHAIGSDEIGLGPYHGSSWVITVRDGEIVTVTMEWEIEKFSPQMWEPFARWVSEEYPRDGVVMYNADQTNFQLTRASIRLWEQHTKEYVKVVNGEE